eukprot:contig_1017_g121
MDVTAPSDGEWALPVVVVPKPGGHFRFCVDYRCLNDMTDKDQYPITRMENSIAFLGDATLFLTLDCNAGYGQIPLADEDKGKTTFTCHKGQFRCKRLPFCLTNAPATFRRAIDIILSARRWRTCLVYLDDLIVFFKTPAKHLEHLREVLALLCKAGVTLKAEKCHLFENEVEYLGHVLSPGELRVNEKNIKALRQARQPKTQTKLKTKLESFLGMCNVSRRFVRDYAFIARSLTKLTGKKLPAQLSVLDEKQTTAF